MNRFLTQAILIVLIAVSSATSLAVADDALRVMSFNIRYGSANDGDNHWKNRHQLVIDTITEFDPDLLGTQETLGFQAQYLKQHLPEYTYIGSSRDTNPDGEQCGVLFRSSRFDQVDSGQFWLSETPDVKFSKSWDSSLPRIATWVRLVDKSGTDANLLFINTHFDHRGSRARLESAKLIRRFIDSQPQDLPFIVTGDFNCAEKSDPYDALTGSPRILDSYRSLHDRRHQGEGTFNGFRGTTDGDRIDWILFSPQLKPTAVDIIRTHENGRYPSDHFPVSAILTVK